MTYPIEDFVLAIVRGRYSQVQLAPPLWHPDALISRARRALASADRPPLSDPRHVAIALGIRLLPRAPSGLCGEGCAPGVVAYDWSAEPKLRGMLVSHGTGHHILRTQPEDSNEADAWLLTIALLLAPHEIHSLTPAEIIRRAYLPERIAREALIELRGCFPEAC